MIHIKKIFYTIIILTVFLTNSKTEIKDSLFATIGNEAITRSDIINEIKVILILNGKTFKEEDRDRLQESAIKSLVKRTIKEIEIKKYDFLEYNKKDFYDRLEGLASDVDMDVETLKSICAANEIDFSIIVSQIESELLWNTLIYEKYKNRLLINQSEIEEQLQSIQVEKGNEIEYLISEIIIKPVSQDKLESTINDLKEKIKTEGFEKIALNFSISESSKNSGDLGWINQNTIAKKIIPVISNTPVGNISEPIVLPQGILIFKIRDKKVTKKSMNLEEAKRQLVNDEKSKILQMYSLSHFDKVRREVSINYF